MSDKDEGRKAEAPMLRAIFQGCKGRPPKTDQELEGWLASAEGKVATALAPIPALRWGEIARS